MGKNSDSLAVRQITRRITVNSKSDFKNERPIHKFVRPYLHAVEIQMEDRRHPAQHSLAKFHNIESTPVHRITAQQLIFTA